MLELQRKHWLNTELTQPMKTTVPLRIRNCKKVLQLKTDTVALFSDRPYLTDGRFLTADFWLFFTAVTAFEVFSTADLGFSQGIPNDTSGHMFVCPRRFIFDGVLHHPSPNLWIRDQSQILDAVTAVVVANEVTIWQVTLHDTAVRHAVLHEEGSNERDLTIQVASAADGNCDLPPLSPKDLRDVPEPGFRLDTFGLAIYVSFCYFGISFRYFC